MISLIGSVILIKYRTNDRPDRQCYIDKAMTNDQPDRQCYIDKAMKNGLPDQQCYIDKAMTNDRPDQQCYIDKAMTNDRLDWQCYIDKAMTNNGQHCHLVLETMPFQRLPTMVGQETCYEPQILFQVVITFGRIINYVSSSTVL